jgi:hypothetical protein
LYVDYTQVAIVAKSESRDSCGGGA